MVILLLAFALVFGVIRPFIVEAFRIPSESMAPTLEVGDRVLANKFIYRFKQPDRKDVVIFDVPDQHAPLIKRIVGLPGDAIAVRNGKLFVNGERQNEPYLNEEIPDHSFFETTTVPVVSLLRVGKMRGVQLPKVGDRMARMQRLASAGTFCPNESCQHYARVDEDNLVKFGRSRQGIQRYQCKSCGSIFTATRGTLFHRKRTPVEDILETLALLAEGVRISSLSRAKGFKEDTILSWLREAARHAEAVEEVVAS